jgi:hypothetical protein
MSVDQSYRFGPFHVDPVNARVMRGTESLLLTPKAFAVLQYLIEHQGRLVTKKELLAAVWSETVVSPGVLKVTILELRKDTALPAFYKIRKRKCEEVGLLFLGAGTALRSWEARTRRVTRARKSCREDAGDYTCSCSGVPWLCLRRASNSACLPSCFTVAQMRSAVPQSFQPTSGVGSTRSSVANGSHTPVQKFTAGMAV